MKRRHLCLPKIASLLMHTTKSSAARYKLQKLVFITVCLPFFGCTPVEDGGGWNYGRSTEAIGKIAGSPQEKTGTIVVHVVEGGGLGQDFFLSGTHIAWIAERDTVTVKVPPGEYDLCVDTIRRCSEPRPTNISVGNGQHKCFSYRAPKGVLSDERQFREVNCADFASKNPFVID